MTPFNRIMLIAAAAVIVTGCTTTMPERAGKMAASGEEPPAMTSPDETAAELDSLAAASVGPYVHLRVGHCFGWCDMRVSLYRDSPAHRYVYEAEAWRFDHEERRPVRYMERKQVSDEVATRILTDAVGAGLFRLVADTTMAITDQSYIWVRAGGGSQTLAIDNAYLGGERYMDESRGERLALTFQNVRDVLTQRLFTND